MNLCAKLTKNPLHCHNLPMGAGSNLYTFVYDRPLPPFA